MHTIESCVSMCRGNNKGQQSLGLAFRCGVHIHHSLLHGETIPDVKQCLTVFWVLVLPHASSKQYISLLEGNILSCAHPFLASGQEFILTLHLCPVGHVHGCQPEGMGLWLLTKVILFHSQGLTHECFSPLSCAGYCSFQEWWYGILIMSDRYSAQWISSSIVWSSDTPRWIHRM